MSFVRKIVKDLRKEYKEKEANKVTIELMHITRAIRKGDIERGKVNEKLSI